MHPGTGGNIRQLARFLRWGIGCLQTWRVAHNWLARPASALVGRRAEVEGAASLIEALTSGRGHVLLISGEPGIGKTALLAMLRELAAAAGARIAYGTAEELEERLPFAAITACLGLAASPADREAAGIAALLGGAERLSGGASAVADAQFLVTEAILALVDQWCAAGAVMLAVDDLQWADRASLLVLHRLGQVASQLPLLVAAAYRTGARDEQIAPLIRSWQVRGCELVTLGPLDEESVSDLTRTVIGASPSPGLLRLMAAAGGNPLYVTELAAALSRDGRLRVTDGLADAGPDTPTSSSHVPPSLAAGVARRLAVLSKSAREVLPVAAILGGSFTVAELSIVTGSPASALLGVVQESIQAGVLVAEADRLTFRHEVIRQTLYTNVPASARNALHLQAGQALAGAGGSVERAAQHLLAGMTMDGAVLAWLADNADRLSARAPELAAELLSRAVQMADPTDDQLRRLRAELATALLRAGRFEDADITAREALATEAGGGPEARLRWVMVHARINLGDPGSALAAAQRALASGGLTRAETARFHGLIAQLLHIMARPEPLASAERARDEGLASGDPHAAAYGLQATAGAKRWDGRFAEALDLAGQAAAYLQRARPLVDGQLDPHLIRANCLVELDREDEAREAYASDLRDAEHGLGTFFLCFHHLSVARLLFLQGRWDDALTEISAAREPPDHLCLTPHLNGLATVIAVHRDQRADLERNRAGLEQPLTTGSSRNTFDDRSWGWGMAAHADNDPEAALAVLEGAWQECVAGNREFCGHYLLPDLVGLAVSLRAHNTARRAVAELDRYAADREAPALRRSARFAAGLATGDIGLLLNAAGEYAAVGRPLFEGQAREHAADLLAAAGRLDEARFQLDAAQDRYASLDAAWDAARADARLRRHGIRRGIRGQRRRPHTGWAALTETEQKIAALVAVGLSNPDIASRMFISRRTVQFHVSNILAKLGLGSRVELAALVARRAG